MRRASSALINRIARRTHIFLGSPFLHMEGDQKSFSVPPSFTRKGVRGLGSPPPATTEPDLLSQVQGLAPAQGVRFLLALALSLALSACGTMQQSTTYYPLTDKTAPMGKNVLDVPPEKFTADLVTPAGFKVKTNGQYKTEAQLKAAAAAIDRYWSEIQKCATDALQTSGTANDQRLVAEFPTHLSIEIANTWKVVEGPATHRRMQAFPSLARPGGWSTARREEDELYIVVVPELNGLGPQMAGELNLWLSRQTTLLADIASTCSSVPCLRFTYNNTPSQAWNECVK